MESRIIAVFDFDKTLTAGMSIESSFLKYLVENRKLRAQNLLNAALYYMKHIFKSPDEALKRNKMYLKGITTEQALLWVRDFIKERGDKLISMKNLQHVKSHKDAGHTTILISGSPDILIDSLDMYLWFDLVYTTRLKSVDGIYTGRINGPHYYGKTKADLIKRLKDELDADLKESFCYADSIKDIEMLSLFGHPVAVNPDRHLIQVALRQHWEILK